MNRKHSKYIYIYINIYSSLLADILVFVIIDEGPVFPTSQLVGTVAPSAFFSKTSLARRAFVATLVHGVATPTHGPRLITIYVVAVRYNID